MADTNYTIREKEALKEFRFRIKDILEEKKVDEFQSHDVNLLRWIKAREFKLDSAEAMFRKSLKWREAENIDNILSVTIPDFLLNQLPFQVPGLNKDGCIICIVPLGRWDLKSVMESGHKDKFMQYVDQILEKGFHFMQKNSDMSQNKMYTQFVIIFDFHQFSLAQVMSRMAVSTMMECLSRFEANYPETLLKAYAVNAPKVFELLWPLLRPLLSGHTLSKVHIFGCNVDVWRAELAKDIDYSQLPSAYGGSNTTQNNYHSDHGLEWLPRSEFFEPDEFQTEVIPAGEKLIKAYNLQAGSRISWNFKTEGFDIGFSFMQNDKELYECSRADSHICTQIGLVDVPVTTTYSLVFSNVYSKFRSKTLHWAVRIENKKN